MQHLWGCEGSTFAPDGSHGEISLERLYRLMVETLLVVRSQLAVEEKERVSQTWKSRKKSEI